MGTLKTQFSEAFRKLEEAAEVIRTLTEKIREEIGEEQSVPLFQSKEEVLLRLFPGGLPLEKLNGELQTTKSKHETRKAGLRSEIENGLARVRSLENECDGIEKRCRRIEEIYKDLFGDTNGAGEIYKDLFGDTTGVKDSIDAGRVYRDLERVFEKPCTTEDKNDILA